MPPAYEVLLLNTAIPQIQAAQSGDTYVVPRDIAINATAIISANSATDALRITQTGAGNAILVEDSANPDSTPFVVTAAGDVGIGTTSTSSARLSIGGTLGTIVTATRAVQIADSAGGALFIGKDNSDYSYLIHDAAAQTSNWFYRGAVGLTMSNVGNLGLGVPPSVWGSGYAALQIKQTALYTTATEVELGSNHFVNSSGQFAYIGNGFATRYEQYLGAHSWHTAPNNTSGAGFAPISFTQAMTLDASGRLGIGETNPTTRLYVKSSGGSGTAATLQTDAGVCVLNFINTGTTSGTFLGSTGTALYFATDGAERARIAAGNGNFLVQVTDPAMYDTNAGGDVNTYFRFKYSGGNGSTNVGVALSNDANDGAVGFWRNNSASKPIRGAAIQSNFTSTTAGSEACAITFLTQTGGAAVTERARITSGGYFKASNNGGDYISSTDPYHELRTNATGDTVIISNSNGSQTGANIVFKTARAAGTTAYFLYGEANAVNTLNVFNNGNITNTNGSYGTISDQKLKQDIVDAGSQWDDIKAIRFRKYRMKSDVAVNPDAPALLGVVAQELEQVSPGLVDEHPDMETVEVTDEDGNVTQTQQPTGTTTKTVKSSILLMKAAVALQEAMARIEQLEAKVAALEAK